MNGEVFLDDGGSVIGSVLVDDGVFLVSDIEWSDDGYGGLVVGDDVATLALPAHRVLRAEWFKKGRKQ